MVTLTQDWNKSSADIFWGEIAPAEHVLQIYESDHAFIESLTGFVGGGIKAGDSVIVIATEPHLKALEQTLTRLGIHLESLISDHRYMPLSAENILEKFMVNGWPDEALFHQTVSGILAKAKKQGRKIRAFGEMVAVLWSQGMNGATVQLEHLWNKFSATEKFSLYCAYPRTGFTNSPEQSVNDICCKHSLVIDGATPSMTDVLYKTA
jgi:hypothetical protein